MRHTYLTVKLEDESPVLAKATANQEDFVNRMFDTLQIEDADTLRPFAQALLNPPTYRVLRLRNGLDFDAAAQYTAQTLICLLDK